MLAVRLVLLVPEVACLIFMGWLVAVVVAVVLAALDRPASTALLVAVAQTRAAERAQHTLVPQAAQEEHPQPRGSSVLRAAAVALSMAHLPGLAAREPLLVAAAAGHPWLFWLAMAGADWGAAAEQGEQVCLLPPVAAVGVVLA